MDGDLIEESGAAITVGFPWWLRPILMRGVVAITIGRRIWVRSAPVEETLLRHELTHVRQMSDVGLPRFVGRYLYEYVRNRLSGMSGDAAYRNISFEREAFAAETYNRRTGKEG
jgi:hypothetical protein